jgi:GT2 family glycosyltransferase
MLSVFKEKSNVGTVGARLHFKDNTIQHNGMILFKRKENDMLQLSHLGLNSYYGFNNSDFEVMGNTAALMMIRKTVFEKCGFFNENYIDCLEDVELNLTCISIGLKNYLSSKSVAYHYESQTRDENEDKIKNMTSDYVNTLLPFISSKINKIHPYIITSK